jgi:HK97 gp10 family phage protein
MAPPVFVENRAGIEAMLRSRSVELGLRRIGAAIKDRAERISPVDTGHYRNSWYLESVRPGDGRPFVRVGNRAAYARYLEYGTRYMKRQRILGRALDAVERG